MQANMQTDTTPYDTFNPGELIAAERLNAMQVAIKEDIHAKVETVQDDLDEFKEQPVDADTFGGQTPDEWKAYYDERYVLKADLEGSLGQYRRYFKQLALPSGTPLPALIEHNLGRYPVVSLFELAELRGELAELRGGGDPNETEVVRDADKIPVKFLVYYAGHRDPDAARLMTRAGTDALHWGDPIQDILDQFGLQVTDTQYFDDVLNDLWGKIFDPGLEQDHFRRNSYGHTKYVQDQLLGNSRTVKELKDGGVWPDLRLAIRPQMIPTNISFDSSERADNAPVPNTVQVFHLSQNLLEIRAQNKIDLMVVLRT
ncbi:hypothetical protein PN498_13975 [Oscillatoria sp. CS-180]|uniref:hypothetical protein n=1 Tax=Oscillatoria sp. CS-180 TaxID=3021720 RepID=UPI0023310CEF|nr:hypothetical protein [Oscillatoria sp. CS-180]MDB9527105.1 hypothetical protein [Oscillatoria sp. CS-180]